MSINQKLLAVRTHLRAKEAFSPSDKQESNQQNHSNQQTTKQARVQKNLSLLKNDADRLKALAKRENSSQAKLLSKALDAFEMLYGPLK